MAEVKSKNSDTLTIVIFGATGDLARRKLIPSLFNLYQRKKLPEKFRMVGFSRGDMSHETYRTFISEALKDRGHSSEASEKFCSHLYFVSGTFEDATAYTSLEKELFGFDTGIGQCSNKLFYLAVPPPFYEAIFQNLADSGLSIPCTDEVGWTRVLVEKPFGRDLKTAQELDKKLTLLFKENQIFRIDHYLAKETLENILAFRFSNLIFDPVWNRKYVDTIHITLSETIGIESRGSFYESVGALRDVVENHVLQMLALIAMENPGSRDANAIRESRAAVLESLTPIEGASIGEKTVKGQYEGYRDEEEVDAVSKVATYFKIVAHINSDRWAGVPFVLEGGKKLAAHKTEIVVYFKDSPTCICDEEEQHQPHANTVKFSIAPSSGISVSFWAKKPGFSMGIEPRIFSFSYEDSFSIPDAYEKLLLSAVEGDQTLFTSSAEVEAAWKFITPILRSWEKKEPHIYAPGSSGPEVSKRKIYNK